MLNIFSNISKSLSNAWGSIFDATHSQPTVSQAPTFDTYMNDPNISKQGKYKMLSDVQSGNISEEDANGIISHIYNDKAQNTQSNNFQLPVSQGFQMHETIPWSEFLQNIKATVNPNDSVGTNVAKEAYNFIPNLVQLGIGSLNLWSTAIQEWVKWALKWDMLAWPKAIYNTAVSGVVNPTLSWVQNTASDVSQSYNQWGILPAINTALDSGIKFVWENPAMAMGLVKPSAVWKMTEKVMLPITKPTWAIISKAWDYVKAGMNEWIPWIKGQFQSDISPITSAPSKLWNVLSRTIPEKTIANSINLNTSDIERVQKITGKQPEQIILESNLWGLTQEQLADHYMRQASDMYQWINTELWKINTQVSSPNAKMAIGDMLETFDWLSNLEKIHYAPDIAYLKELAQKDTYSLTELNNLRRAFDKVNTWMYTAKWEMKTWTRDQAEIWVRNWLSEDIQSNALKSGIDVRQMNENLRVWLAMKDWLIRRIAKNKKNNLVWLQDLGIMWVFSNWEPLTALAVWVGKHYIQEKLPSISQGLFNTNKAKYEKSPLTRGNTISTGNSTILFNRPSRVGSNSPISLPQEVIPWSSKTTIETPFNPKGNQSKTLAKKSGVMVEEKPKTLLLSSGERFIQAKNNAFLKELSTAQSAARLWGEGSTRIIPKVLDKINSWEVTRQQAIDVLEKIIESKNLDFSYTKKPIIQDFIDKLYNSKFDTKTGEITPSPTLSTLKKWVVTPRKVESSPKGEKKGILVKWEKSVIKVPRITGK